MWWYLEVDVIEYVQSLQKQFTSPPEVKSNADVAQGLPMGSAVPLANISIHLNYFLQQSSVAGVFTLFFFFED